MLRFKINFLVRIICLTSFLLASCVFCSDEDLDTFKKRRDWILDTVSSNPDEHIRYPFFTAECCFIRGKVEDGKRIARKAYLGLPNNRARQVEMFTLWQAMDCYLRWETMLDDESKDAFKKVVTSTTYYDEARTSNLVTLAKVIRYLGSQAWGEEAFMPEAAFRKADPNAEKALFRHLEDIARWGLGEYASRPYMCFNLFPILTLAECAKDPEMRKRASIAYEAAVAQFAATWLNGSMGVASGRSYPDLLCMEPSGSARGMWIYYGGTVKPRITQENMAPAVMNYVPDPIIELAASDRSKPFTAKSHFCYQLQNSYQNGQYVLFCEMQWGERQNVDIWQTYPYGVMWIEPDVREKFNFLWMTVPCNDTPEKVSPSGPHGVMGSVQGNVQHEDCLLYVCDLSQEKIPFKYLLCFVPGGYRASINESGDGRIFLHYGTVLIAISSTKGFDWNPASGLRTQQNSARKGDSEFRIDGAKFAAAIETAPPSEFIGADPESQLKAFREKILSSSKITADINDKEFAGSYTGRKGATIRKVFKGSSEIAGKELNLSVWPMLENPWMLQKYGGNLTIHDGKRAKHFDFDKWTVTEEPAEKWIARTNSKWTGFRDGKVDILSLPDLELWLDSSGLKEGPLECWQDLSGNGNDAKPISNENLKCTPPIVVPNAINGKAAVRFSDRNPGNGLTTPTIFVPEKTIDAFIVASSDEQKGKAGPLLAYQGLGYYLERIQFAQIWNDGDTCSINFGVPLDMFRKNLSATAKGAWRNKTAGIARMSIIADGTSVLRINGSAVCRSETAGCQGTMRRPLLIGADDNYRYVADSFFNGDIAEIIVCSQIVDEITASQIEKYLSGKWNIPIDNNANQ